MVYGDYVGPDKPDKGKEGGSCNRGSCQCAPARWYNHGSYSWYCDDCRQQIESDPINGAGWQRDFYPRLQHPMFETRQMMDTRQNPSPQTKADGRQATNGSQPSYAIFEGVADDDGHTAKEQSLRVPNAEAPPQMKSVLRLIVGPEALTPGAEPLGENIGEIRASEGRETVDSGLTALFDNLGSARVAEDTEIAFHNGLRTEARAHASPSRREIGDDAHVGQMPEKETPAPPQTNKDGRSAIGVSRPSGATHEQIDCDRLDIDQTASQQHLSAGANILSDSYREHPACDGRSMECYAPGSNLVQSLCQSESNVFSQQNHRDALNEVSQAGRVLDDAPSALGLLDSAVAHPLGISRHKTPQLEEMERRPAPVRPGASLPPNAIHGSTEMESSPPTSSPSTADKSDEEDRR